MAIRDPRPAAAFRHWRRQPWTWHLAAFLVLVGVMFVRWRVDLTVRGTRVDEAIYQDAFTKVLEGESPYRADGYFYTPAFAYFGAWLRQYLPQQTIVDVFRAANVAGLCWTVWLSMAWVPLALGWRLALGGAVIWLTQGVALGMSSGNISFAIVGSGLAALACWPRRPLLAGTFLGLGVAVKPIFPAALPLLALHRPAGGGRRQRVAGALAMALTGGLILSFPHLSQMVAQQDYEDMSTRAFSFERMLGCFGLEVSAFWVAVAVTVGATLTARLRPLAPVQLLCLSVTVVTLATPLLWSHSMIVALPLETLALTLAVRRFLAAPGSPLAGGRPRRHRLYELVLVALASAAILFCDGIDGVYDKPLLVQGLVIALPTLAPAALTAYILRRSVPF